METRQYSFLNKIDSPEDLKGLSIDYLPQVCDELRQFVINELSQNIDDQPDFEQDEIGESIETSKNNVQDAIERASLMAREGKNNLIKMSFRDDVLKISSNDRNARREHGKIPLFRRHAQQHMRHIFARALGNHHSLSCQLLCRKGDRRRLHHRENRYFTHTNHPFSPQYVGVAAMVLDLLPVLQYNMNKR